jgi:hypothetical protein
MTDQQLDNAKAIAHDIVRRYGINGSTLAALIVVMAATIANTARDLPHALEGAKACGTDIEKAVAQLFAKRVGQGKDDSTAVN